ncbi:MAG: hypothetical protein M1290_06425 [Candidatus Thermoplasmatota archaeon]|jgi:hypothetical protein|nr:hypothetical protein [Candidatus Thermoplasmatota archaeon]MCL5790079.1 hypothetical protein [Candidatus Thermoplasmatota archaeon]
MLGRPTVSDIFDLYDQALDQTRDRLENRVIEGTRALDTFYRNFLKDHVIQYAPLFRNESFRREMHRILQQRHRSTNLRFWAIDGACEKLETSDLAIFYGGAYVVKGELGLQSNPPLLSYNESEPEDDSSLVAYLPLSPEDLTAIDPENRFIVDDAERISIAGLDTSLMLLAEIFMCYRGASGTDRPHLILWDHSLASVLANATPNVRELRFSGVQIAGETIWYPDLLVGYSKPWDRNLDVPSKKSHRLWERAIAKIYESEEKKLDLEEFSRSVNLPIGIVERQVRLIWESNKLGEKIEGTNPSDALVKKTGKILTLNQEYINSTYKIERMFLYFCNKLYRDKDPSILIYNFRDEQGAMRSRFLSKDELSFLLAIGLRLTFEAAWRNGVIFIGISKDSASTYFTNHYLGVMRFIGRFNFNSLPIPATDRLTFERIPEIDGSIEGPWSSTEFDALFMTLRMRREFQATNPTMQGVRGDVLVQPNLIMKSLVQFHYARNPPTEPSMSHVIFVDRLIHPSYQPSQRMNIITGDPDLGTLEPFIQINKDAPNREQELSMYLLSVLTRNVFPEVIGYPDPLHHADRGAKAVLRMVEPMLRSSEWLNRADPIHRTLRQNRDG